MLWVDPFRVQGSALDVGCWDRPVRLAFAVMDGQQHRVEVEALHPQPQIRASMSRSMTPLRSKAGC
jgi:hypothetical protein